MSALSLKESECLKKFLPYFCKISLFECIWNKLKITIKLIGFVVWILADMWPTLSAQMEAASLPFHTRDDCSQWEDPPTLPPVLNQNTHLLAWPHKSGSFNRYQTIKLGQSSLWFIKRNIKGFNNNKHLKQHPQIRNVEIFKRWEVTKSALTLQNR